MILNDAQNNMEAALYLQIQNDTVLKTILAKYVDDITKDGWAMAGGFYQRLGGLREEMGNIYAEPVFEATKPDLSALPDDLLGEHVKNNYSVIYDRVISTATTGTSYTSNSFTSDISGFRAQFGTDPKGLSVDSLGNRSSGYMSSAVGKIMQGSIDTLVGTDGHVDMLARIKTLGDSLKLADTVISALIYDVHFTLDTMQIIAAGADAVKVVGTGLNTAPVVDGIRRLFDDAFAKNLAQLASWLGRLAFWFGIFIPTLPYFIFLMAVVGWILSVVQAMVAAPLWAVMHMTPERSFIGGQSQGYLLLLSLFARPPLILVGLFVAIAAINPIIQYVSIFFFAVRNANVTSSESLGWFMQFLTFKDWLIMYALVITPIIYMVFGLSQSLPDTVLSWIGAGIRSMGETNATSEMRSAMIGHDASNTISSGNRAINNKSGANKLPPGGTGGANPTYGTGNNSRGNSPQGGGGGGSGKPASIIANPQGVTPNVATSAQSTNSQAGFSASAKPAATNSNSSKVLNTAGQSVGHESTANSSPQVENTAKIQEKKDTVLPMSSGVVPREIEKI